MLLPSGKIVPWDIQEQNQTQKTTPHGLIWLILGQFVKFIINNVAMHCMSTFKMSQNENRQEFDVASKW